LHQQKVHTLLAEIAAGRWAAGEQLPLQKDLAAEWDVGLDAVHEVICDLEQRGVVTVTPHQVVAGTPRHVATITPIERWDLLDREVQLAMLAGPDGPRFMGELMDARSALEVEASRLAATRRTEHHLAAMAAAIGATRTAQPFMRSEPGIDFHRALAHASANRPLARALESLLDAFENAADSLPACDDDLDDHESILHAVHERDAERAAEAMAAHLTRLAVPASAGHHEQGRPRRVRSRRTRRPAAND
jgi:DNA-binding FadR family transcriptional regulator